MTEFSFFFFGELSVGMWQFRHFETHTYPRRRSLMCYTYDLDTHIPWSYSVKCGLTLSAVKRSSETPYSKSSPRSIRVFSQLCSSPHAGIIQPGEMDSVAENESEGLCLLTLCVNLPAAQRRQL